MRTEKNLYYGGSTCHCEECSAEAIHLEHLPAWIAAPHKKHSARKDGQCDVELL
ncbi:MAG: hypothetical protein LBH05_04745 [Deferribacteraceae bacterium]|nr:hypothetical protein [Deferribacteraceae bacterium]